MTQQPPLLRALSPELRVSLNVARAAAAVYVVVHHVAQHHLHGALSIPFRFGQEAVIVFFLLSGFVIFANERDRVRTAPGAYLLRRIRRVYPAMLLSLVLAGVLWQFDDGYAGTFTAQDLVGTLLQVQDLSPLKPGVIVDPVFNNNPLWSLSYEMLFYLAFPLVMLAWRRSPGLTNVAVGVVAVAGYVSYIAVPNHWSLMASYFLLWWAGAVLADNYVHRRAGIEPAALVLGSLAALTAAACVAVAIEGQAGFGLYPVLMVRHFGFALLCVVLVLSPLGAVAARLSMGVARPAEYLASISYGLYVFHYPLLLNWSFADSAFGFAVALVALVILSVVGDRVVDRVLPRPKPRRLTGTPDSGKVATTS